MKRSDRGLSLAEVLISLALLGGLLLFTRMGVNYINMFVRQKSLLEKQRDAQVITYSIIREIRNAKQIQEVAFDKLVLRAFDTQKFNYNEAALFDSVNIGTITYQFKTATGVSYLERKREFQGLGGGSQTVRLFLGSLLTPDTTDYIFKGGPGMIPPYDTVDVVVRLSPAAKSDPPITYRETAFRRSSAP